MTIRARLAGKGAASATHVVPLPGTAAVGDRVFVGFVNDHAHASASASTGWSPLGTRSQSTTTNHTMTVFTRVLDGGADDALTVSITDTVDGNARAAQWVVEVQQGNGGTPQTVVFSDGGGGTGTPGLGTVGAITGLASGDYDSIIFLGLDNSDGETHTVTAPSGWGNVTHTFASTDLVGAWGMDQSATGVTGFTPADVSFTNQEQWVTAHVVVAQASGGSTPTSPTFVAAGTSIKGSGVTNAVIDAPDGIVEGDIVLVHLYKENSASVTPASGFAEIAGSPIAVTTGNAQWHHLFWKRATASEPSSYTFSWSGSTYRAGQAGAYRGCIATGSPFDASNSAANSSSSTSTPAVAVTTTGPNRLLVWAGTNWNESNWTAPTGFTLRGTDTNVTTTFATRDQPTAGGSGNVTGTASNANTTTAWLVALLPASSGPTEVEKTGSDSGTGAESGGVSATATGSDTATGSESGRVAIPGSDAGTGSEDGYVQEGKLGGDVGSGTETYDSSATVTSGEAAEGQELGNTSAVLDPPGDVAEGTAFGHIAIPGEDTAEGIDEHLAPTFVTVTTGESTVGTEGGYVETLFGDLIINFFVVDPEDGSLIALPDYESLDFSRERNSRGSLRQQYPITGKDFALLRSSITADRDLEFEIWTNGTPVGALRGYLQEAAGDDVVADDNGEDGSWQFAGSFLECRTDEVIVFPQDRGALVTNPDTGEQEWTNPRRELIVNADNPGELMTLLLEQAQDRGALTDIVADFTPSLDSNGQPWDGVLTAKFSPGSTYTQILDRLVKQHLVEWAIVWDWENQQKVFKLWNAEGRGADLTLGPRPVTLRRGRNLLDAPQKWSVRDSATTLLAAGAEGVYVDTTDATALARRDRRVESYASLANATDEEAVLGFAQAELSTISRGLRSVEHGIGMLPGEPRPIIAFDIGDWVYSQSSEAPPERLRVVQWELSLDIDRNLSGKVALNDTWMDAVEKMRERLDAITSGEVVVGTSEPTAPTEDRTPPAAPEGVVASSIAYQDPLASGGAGGQTLAFVTVGWNPVTTNADGADNPLVQAAIFILDKLEEEELNPEVPDPEQEDGGPNYDPIQADWTWKNCPQIVRDFADDLQLIWNDDGNPPAQPWLAAYIAEASQTPTAADDVDGYDVRYAYLGLDQVGGIPSSDPFPEEDRFYYPATPPEGTSSTEYSFGGVEAGSRLRIEVRAFDRTGNYGPWATISHDTEVDNSAPPPPSAPDVKVWFRTLDIAWDGLGSEDEPMPFDFAKVRVWVGQGADMTLPAEPVEGPVPFDPLVTTPQYVRDIALGAGATNVPDLPYDVGWYVRLQAVDRTGNVSGASAVAGPFTADKLFPDDLRDGIIDHPDKIAFQVVDTQHIVNAAIVNALIADATIEAAKIGSVSAGSIITGTMTATITVTGTLATSLNPGHSRLTFSGAGLQLYRSTGPSSSVLVGEWRTSDGSMLVTGTFRSNTEGERIHIDPDGSIRLYPPSGTNFSQITNRAGEAVWRGPLDGSQRSGRVNVNMLGVGINFSAEANLLEAIRAEFVVFDRRMRSTAPFIELQVDERWTNPVGGSRRVQFSWIDSNGDFLSRSGISYGIDSNDWGGFYGNDTGIKFARVGPNGSGNDGRVVATNGTLGNYGLFMSNGTDVVSSGKAKTDIEDARSILDPLETIRNARARKFRTVWDPDEKPRIGVIAEELPEVLQRPMAALGEEPLIGIELSSQIGVLWGAINQLLDQETRIVTGRALVPNGTYRSGDVVDVPITWDVAAPEVPSDVTAIPMASMPTAMGKIRALVVPGSVTETGATIRLTFSGIGATAVNAALPIAVEATGRYIWTPPYVPPEEA